MNPVLNEELDVFIYCELWLPYVQIFPVMPTLYSTVFVV